MAVGIGAAVGSAFGGLFGGAAGQLTETVIAKAADRLMKRALEEAKSHAKAYLGTPTSHDLERSLRFAMIVACLAVVNDQAVVEEGDRFDTRDAPPDAFTPAARAWLHGRLRALGEVPKGAHAAEIEAFRAACDTALVARHDPREAEEAAQRRAAAEAAMWGEITEALANTPFPEGFPDRFRGGAEESPGWFAYAIAFLREGLREKPDARVAFFVAGLSDLKNAARRLEEGQAREAERAAAADATTHELLREALALFRQGGGFTRAADAGISEAAVRRVVERLGAEGLERDDLLPWLDQWIESAREQLARHVNEDTAFEAAIAEANRRFRAGKVETASDALMNELEREEQTERSRQEERQRRRLRLLEEAIRYDELALQPEAAVAKLRRMGELRGATDRDAMGAWLFEQAGKLYHRGSAKGQNAALLFAIAAYRAALEQRTRERVPLDWAMTQNNLGNALLALGERESGTARLTEAVAAYRAALEEYTRERMPLSWATTQNNLGIALATLGARENGTARLTEAVEAHRAALEERTRERVPLDWAQTQNNLGSALQTLGARESGTARLTEAVAAYRAALKEWTRERVPLQWAGTQNNLGIALATLGARESGTARLTEAVEAHRAALEERTRERVPLDWAGTQNNLGNTLLALGAREVGTARLTEAVAAYRAALEEWTRERVPLQWAGTQNNLGNALSALGARESGTARLTEAIAACRAALEERTRERVPFFWAQTVENLARAEQAWGDKTQDPARWRAALNHVEAALEEYLAAGAEYDIARVTRLRDDLAARLAAPN